VATSVSKAALSDRVTVRTACDEDRLVLFLAFIERGADLLAPIDGYHWRTCLPGDGWPPTAPGSRSSCGSGRDGAEAGTARVVFIPVSLIGHVAQGSDLACAGVRSMLNGRFVVGCADPLSARAEELLGLVHRDARREYKPGRERRELRVVFVGEQVRYAFAAIDRCLA
jgi:hypothetical protein